MGTIRESSYVAATVGAAIGAVIIATLFWTTATAVAWSSVPVEPECSRYACNRLVRAGANGVYGLVMGWWIGAGLGSWGMLRPLRHPHAELTGILALPAHFFGSALMIGLSAAILLFVRETAPEPLVSMYLLLFGLALPFEAIAVSVPIARKLALVAARAAVSRTNVPSHGI